MTDLVRPAAMRLDVIADFSEEQWPSMDLCAEMLVRSANEVATVECSLVRPSMWTFSRRPVPTGLERSIGRFVQYPLALASHPRRDRWFHIADHTYAHLAHFLPANRCGIYCHDIDAFRALLRDTRKGAARRAMAHLILRGMRKAAVVFHSTEFVRNEILAANLLSPQVLVQAPLGTAEEYNTTPTHHDYATRQRFPGQFLLHVGSCVPRKNTSFLLRLFHALLRERPDLVLLQVGGTWREEQQMLIQSLGLSNSVHQIRGLSRAELAAAYRQAAAVLVPSRSEGFGIPVIEALACGAPVIASDLPVLREVGNGAVLYGPIDDLAAWTELTTAVLERRRTPNLEVRLARARRFTWNQHARTILDSYSRLRALAAPQ